MSCRCPIRGVPAAIGYAQESGIPFELGIIRSHYVGRTFIQPGDQVRHLGVKLKHNANSALIQGKSIVLVDDFDRARHDQPEDRPDDARGRRARGPYADRQPADPPHPASTASTRPSAPKLLAAQMDVAEMNRLYPAPTASPSSRSTASTARSARRRATRPSRSIATPASPATIRPASPTRRIWSSATSWCSRKNAWPDARGVRQAGWRWSPAPAAASARRSPRRWRRGRACRPDRADRRRPRGGRGADPRRRRIGDDRAARPDRDGQHRQARAGGGGALAGARHAGAQRRDARHADAGRAEQYVRNE